MEPDRPHVTITDPMTPAGTPDLLSSGRDPWRPGRRLVLVTPALALTAAMVGGAVGWVHHVHNLDRAAVADVSIYFADSPRSHPGAGFGVALGSGGTKPVRVLTVELLGVGHSPVEVDRELTPQAYLPVTLPWGRVCSPALYRAPPAQLRVRVRTARGAQVEREVALDPDTATSLAEEERRHCGLLNPDEAVTSRLVDARRSRSTVVAELTLFNDGVLPVTVTKLTAFPGITASSRLPVSIPPRRRGAVTLQITLRITDCRHVRSNTQQVAGLTEPDSLLLGLDNGYVQTDLPLLLLFSDGEETHHDRSVAVAPYLRQLCPYGARNP